MVSLRTMIIGQLAWLLCALSWARTMFLITLNCPPGVAVAFALIGTISWGVAAGIATHIIVRLRTAR